MVDVFGYPLVLPPPLDGAAGDLLILMAVWVVVATVAVFAMRRISHALKDRIAWIEDVTEVSGLPLFLVLLLIGAQSAFQVVAAASPLPILTQAVDWVVKLTGVGILLVTLYWVFAIYKELLIHYARDFAQRSTTHTSIQPLISLAEKLGLVVIIAVGTITGLASFGIDVTMMAATAGIAGLVIAFAAQDTLANYFSGVSLLLDQPFKEGDWVEMPDGDIARVREVGLRSTSFYRKADHTIVTYPNSMIAEDKIVDLMKPDERYRLEVGVGIHYGGPVQDAMQTLDETVRGHPDVITDRDDLPPSIVFDEFGDSSLGFRVRFWIGHVEDRWRVRSEIHEAIDEAFRDAEIEIPYPQRDLWFRNELSTDADAVDA